jgi:hypothetical protein
MTGKKREKKGFAASAGTRPKINRLDGLYHRTHNHQQQQRRSFVYLKEENKKRRRR